MQQKLDGERATATQEEKESTFTFLCAFFVPFIPTNKIPVISNKGHPPPSHSTSLVLFYVTARKSTASIHTTLIRQTLNKQAALPCHWSDSPISHSTALTPSQITSSKSSWSLTVVPHTLTVENTHTSAYLLAITTQPERSNSHPHPHLRLSSTSVIAPFLVEKKQQHHRQPEVSQVSRLPSPLF